MRRRDVLAGFGAAAAFPRLARTQPIPLIGYLASGSGDLHEPNVEAFRQGLRELGYVDGRNIRIEYRVAGGVLERLPSLAAELVSLRPQIILAAAGEAGLAARHATGTIPIVLGTSSDPLGAGLVASLSRPGGNVTGMKGFSGEVSSKQLGLLQQAVPGLRRFAVLLNRASPSAPVKWADSQAAAAAAGMIAVAVEIHEKADLVAAAGFIAREKAQAILVPQDPTMLTLRKEVVALAMLARLPALYGSRPFADAGGLMSYGNDVAANFRRAASYVDKILKGADPADLPVEQGSEFELVINLKAASALGIAIAPALLLQATAVIE